MFYFKRSDWNHAVLLKIIKFKINESFDFVIHIPYFSKNWDCSIPNDITVQCTLKFNIFIKIHNEVILPNVQTTVTQMLSYLNLTVKSKSGKKMSCSQVKWINGRYKILIFSKICHALHTISKKCPGIRSTIITEP